MEEGAKGCEVIVSGKLRAQRAKYMKFTQGFMKHSGHPVNMFVDRAVRHVLLRQGVMGLMVKIMLPTDPTGKSGPTVPLPDKVCWMRNGMGKWWQWWQWDTVKLLRFSFDWKLTNLAVPLCFLLLTSLFFAGGGAHAQG